MSLDEIVIDNPHLQYEERTQEEVEVRDHCFSCKLFMVLITFLLALGSLAAVAYVSVAAPKANSDSLSISFYIALLNGFITLNMARLYINAVHVPQALQNSEKELFDCWTLMIFSSDAIDMTADLYMIQDIKEQIESAASSSQSP